MQKNEISNDSREVILEHVDERVTLTPAEKYLFISLLTETSFPRKTAILSPGEICKHQSFVVKGCLKIFHLDNDGNEHTAKFAVENWWAFDIESFFQSAPAFYGITSLEQTTVLQLSQEHHKELLDTIPAFERFYRLMLQQSFIALQHRMTQSLAHTAEIRYVRFREKYPGLENRISQREIASYLGITPVFLSMIRKQELTKH